MTGKRQPYGPIDEEALTDFERRLPEQLPDDLRQFLLESNGAMFSDAAELSAVPGGAALEAIFGLHGGPNYLRLDHMFVVFEGRVPPSILVFAADRYGNYFGISLQREDAGCVYFIDHESRASSRDVLVRVAESFGELLAHSQVEYELVSPSATVAVAIDAGDIEGLRKLLETDSDIAGMVHRAVFHGDSRILATVLEGGGDPNELGAIGGTETPLFVAARQGRADLTELLLRHGADPNLRCGVGGSALQMAQPWPQVVQLLVKSGAKS